MMDRIEIDDFQVLLAVAETGSFRKAALRVDRQQSAVSRRVQKLEEALGVSLFERRPSGAWLTEAGSRFVTNARQIVHNLEAAVEYARSAGVAKTGQLRIGLIASLSQGSLREVLTSFLRQHPSVEVSFAEADRGELLTRLSHRTIDVVVAAGAPPPELVDSLLLDREDIFLAVPADSPYAEQDRLAWADVTDAAFIVSAREPGPEIHDYIVRSVSDLGQRAKVRRHRFGREGIMNLVGLGLGVSLVADHWRGVSYPNVTFVPVGEEGETVPFSLTWRPENDNPALRRFLSLARIEAKRNGALSGRPRSPDPSP